MAKLKVDEIEPISTNQNIKVITKGSTGALEIKGDTNDATLQLNCSAQSHGVKLKAPPSSAGQNYTMVTPDNQIAASKLFKVKSVTNNSAQLEYGDAPTAASVLVNLDAGNLTSGTLPAARFPSFPASAGASLKLINSSKVTSDNTIQQIDFTGLPSDQVFFIVGRNIKLSGNGYPLMEWLDSSNQRQGYLQIAKHYQTTSYQGNISGSHINQIDMRGNWSNYKDSYSFTGYFSTNSTSNDWMMINGMGTGMNESLIEIFASFQHNQRWARTLSGLRFKAYEGGTQRYYQTGSEILIYQFMES